MAGAVTGTDLFYPSPLIPTREVSQKNYEGRWDLHPGAAHFAKRGHSSTPLPEEKQVEHGAFLTGSSGVDRMLSHNNEKWHDNRFS